jgi:uncharacterized protein YsxB (DUF464 family)
MIKVQVKRDPQGKIQSFRVFGHAGFADIGTDIVCSAASMLVQNGVNSTEALLNIEIPCDSRDGFVECNVPSLTDQQSDQAQLLLESMVYGLRSLADAYPKHVSVTDTSKR